MQPCVVALLLVSLLPCVCTAQNDTTIFPDTTEPPGGGSCILNADGSYSGPGTCNGPLERSATRYSNLTITNGGCPEDQVLFYVDGDLTQPKCGECKPGVSGLEDTQLACDINDFCDDDGRCRSAKSSPLYGQPCPYEQGGLTRYGWCGPGLRCIQHECSICMDGVLDPSDGKRCVHDEWTYSPWVALVYNPNAIFQLCTLLLLTIYLLFLLLRKTPAWPIAIKWTKKIGTTARKYWRKIKFPSLSLPFRKDSKAPTATTGVSNTSRDGLANNSNSVPSPANQSLEMEEIENYLHANATGSEN